MIKLNFDIKKTTLKNGLKVITVKKDTRIASINVGIDIGAMYESENEKGISHFIEHMLFKGTKSRSNELLNEELESLGGEYNAYTDYDCTVYTISCLEEEIKKGTILLADMIVNSNFPEDEIEKERSVILAEIRTSKDDIEDLSFKKTNEFAFKESYLRYDIIGLEKNVNNFKRKELVEFYMENYIPSNAVITMVSSFEHEEALQIIEENFKDWKGNKKREKNITLEDNIEGEFTSYKNEIEQSTIVYLFTFNDLVKEDELPLRILNHRLGESANSLLFREVRENRGLAYDIFTHLDISRDSKCLYIYTSVSDEDVEEAKKAINNVLNDILVQNIKFKERDLEIMKKVHKTAVIGTLEDSADLCNYVLHQELEKEDLLEFVNDMERINKIEKEEVYDVARKVLKNPTIHILRREN
ncbi:MAG: insulinase family protein [Clostridium baratii]|uniref:Peptidase M16 inactive domain protein n=2 Tax=Clostridium baratii TaxID=1561 RepID=A0A0A7FXS2_9CLOT|nr:pitrilysin family protein [Clostridium baratii]AIY83641.1 peptidase M16 inactive domain protein [Clostridium baratii str. Sullivan]MBS6006610.1 insulinase family protein [Clostridium baratii]MDU1053717.1 pitrilysin family protein [Clostridium baratii]MDU4910617.1 pitrilysin family protein [Clostridium baratii]CUO96153.1 peptidase M16 domain-containing protein [Clostridium baratii]